MTATIPVIDLFAGPGGLSEGFSRHADWTGTGLAFRSVLSIEKSQPAARTLRLRTFFRKFPAGSAPEEYWKVVRGEAAPDSLSNFPEWEAAGQEVWQAELGEIALDQLHGRIADSIGGTRDWVLLGGPPCQAYSLAGRSRMTGIGYDGRSDPTTSEEVRKARLSKFGGDKRHTLYQEYLRILAVHQPAVFVMENVKGILSAKVPGEDLLMFDRIRADLQDPWTALEEDTNYDHLARLRQGGRHHYRLYSFSGNEGRLWSSEPANKAFLIKAEEFGVPQKRHRVIVLGVRDDINDLPARLLPSERRTVRDAIGHLPRVRSGVSRGKSDATEEWLRLRRAPFDEGTEILQSAPLARAIAEAITGDAGTLSRGAPFVPTQEPAPDTALEKWLSAPNLRGFAQHETRSHMASDLARYLYAAAAASVVGKSPKLQDWPKDLLPAHRNVSVTQDGDIESAGFVDRFKVQVWSEAASTITAHIAKDGHYFIHPDPLQTRSLTVRESARLQTFPDDYFFCGNRTEAYTQIGNAVPPLLGLQLATVVAALFPQSERVSPVEDRLPDSVFSNG